MRPPGLLSMAVPGGLAWVAEEEMSGDRGAIDRMMTPVGKPVSYQWPGRSGVVPCALKSLE
jgi:hypothetical protein